MVRNERRLSFARLRCAACALVVSLAFVGAAEGCSSFSAAPATADAEPDGALESGAEPDSPPNEAGAVDGGDAGDAGVDATATDGACAVFDVAAGAIPDWPKDTGNGGTFGYPPFLGKNYDQAITLDSTAGRATLNHTFPFVPPFAVDVTIAPMTSGSSGGTSGGFADLVTLDCAGQSVALRMDEDAQFSVVSSLASPHDLKTEALDPNGTVFSLSAVGASVSAVWNGQAAVVTLFSAPPPASSCTLSIGAMANPTMPTVNNTLVKACFR